MTATAQVQMASDDTLRRAELAVGAALRSGDAISACLETQVQNALHAARCTGCDPDLFGRLENTAAIIYAMLLAQRNGRPNLYASKLLRLKRLILA